MSLGIKGLITTSQNVSYSKALKEAVVSDYLSGLGSLMTSVKSMGFVQKSNYRIGF